MPTSTDDVVIPGNSGTVQIPGRAAANSLELANGTTLQGNTTDSLTITSGVITVDSGMPVAAVDLAGSNGLTTDGATLVATGADTYSGPTQVNGTLIVTTAAALPAGTSLGVGAGGNVDFDPAALTSPPAFQPRPWPAIDSPDQTPAVSAAGVVYATGQSTASADDLGIGTTRLYSRSMGWMLADQPYVVSGPTTAVVVFSPTQSYWFSTDGTSYTPMYGGKETLAADTADHLLDLTMPDGSLYTFDDFSYQDAMAGQFVGCYSPNGNIEIATAGAPRGKSPRSSGRSQPLRPRTRWKLSPTTRRPKTRRTSESWNRLPCKATTARR